MNQSEPGQARRTVPVDQLINSLCATVPDYPKPGIVFKDLTPVFANGAALHAVVDALVEPFKGQFDAVAGVEARGFLLAAAAAYATNTGVITVRKAGKLPRKVVAEDYALEYGTATLELHTTDLPAGKPCADSRRRPGHRRHPRRRHAGCSNAAESTLPGWAWSWSSASCAGVRRSPATVSARSSGSDVVRRDRCRGESGRAELAPENGETEVFRARSSKWL